MHLRCRALLMSLTLAGPVTAQELASTDSLGPLGREVQSWIALRVSPGREAYATSQIREQWSDWKVPSAAS